MATLTPITSQKIISAYQAAQVGQTVPKNLKPQRKAKKNSRFLKCLSMCFCACKSVCEGGETKATFFLTADLYLQILFDVG